MHIPSQEEKMKNRMFCLLAALFCLVIAQSAWAETPVMKDTPVSTAAAMADPGEMAKALSSEQKTALSQVSHSLVTIDELVSRKVLSAEQAKEQREYYLSKAQIIFGQPIKTDNLAELLQKIEQDREKETSSTFQQIVGLISFANFVKVVAVLLIAVGVIWLFITFFLPILIALPKTFLEVAFYAICFVLIQFGHNMSQTEGFFIGLLGCIGLVGCVFFTSQLHRQLHASFLALILSICWAFAAVFYQSQIIGIMSVMAFEAFLGFTVLVLPLCYCIGFDDEAAMARATSASFVILAIYIGAKALGLNLPYSEIFSTGIFYVSTFVYFIGLLIMSSKYFRESNYLLMQILVFCSGLAAVYFGSVLNIPALRGIGGVFFFLYLIEKYVEIIQVNIHWAFGTLGLGALLYFCGLFITNHMEYFMVF